MPHFHDPFLFLPLLESDVPAARAQMVFQGKTNIAEDQFVNTFHFAHTDTNAPYSALTDAIPGMLAEFYFTPVQDFATINGFLSTFLTLTYSIRMYDLGQPEHEREPTIVNGTRTAGNLGSPNLPEEVAVCLSITGPPPVTPRKRGRLYLGPFNAGVLAADVANAPTHVSTTFQGTVAGAARRLINSSATVKWCIRSEAGDALHGVNSGYVDNAFDTQRRRGPKTTARVLVPS